MPIRDILVVGLVFGSIPFCFSRPYVGVLVWSWLGFMNPHRLTWGFAQNIELSQVVAITTLLGLLFTKDRRSIPLVRESILLATFWGLTVLSTVFALYPDLAWNDLMQFSKIVLMSFVTVALFHDRVKLRYLLLVAALSIGYYGFRGGTWGLQTGGEDMVFGPDGSFIGDNNGLGLAFNMTLPLLFFLAREETRRWFRMLLYLIFILTILSVLLTYSRGNLLGLVAVLFALMARTKTKRIAIPLVLSGVVILAVFLPGKWFDRMATITNYTEDGSAMGRLYAWKVGWRLALDSPLLGGGFRVFQPEIWSRYLPEHADVRANAHSIYFHVLGEHGFLGLVVYLGLIVSMFASLRKIRQDAKRVPDRLWLVNYSFMVEASVVGFLVAGAFQNLTYFDLFYFLIGVTIVLKRYVRDSISRLEQGEVIPSVTPMVDRLVADGGRFRITGPSIAGEPAKV